MSNDAKLLDDVTFFSQGLLKYADVKHAGNCFVMSAIVREWLQTFYLVNTIVVEFKVKVGRKKFNHYALLMENGKIIDATASQFENMPKVFIGEVPEHYTLSAIVDSAKIPTYLPSTKKAQSKNSKPS